MPGSRPGMTGSKSIPKAAAITHLMLIRNTFGGP
jgi:hypothetical protein